MEQQNPIPEKRKHPRASNHIPLKLSSAEADFLTETKNISCSGAYCRVSQYIEPMTKLKVLLLLPLRKNGKLVTKKIICGGVVVRTENVIDQDQFNTAIFFNDIHPKDARVINEFVQGILSDPPVN